NRRFPFWITFGFFVFLSARRTVELYSELCALCGVLRWRLRGDSHWRQIINIYKVINIWHRTDGQLQRAPRAQSVIVYLCILCELFGFLVLCGSIGFLWGTGDC
ncbi:MAG: hypothetical protein KKI06_02785, partial [Euryarchaeota archaeon]|nr:hypothetical protein [Euryarchaeota archaeon]